MKKLIVTLTSALLFTSSLANASGTKQPDPNKSIERAIFIVSDSGTKQPDPKNDDDLGGVILGDSGTKQPDPDNQILETDSGYPTLSALLSKYFSI